MQDLLAAIVTDSVSAEHSEALNLIRTKLENKAKEAYAPISSAYYGAIHCYYKSNQFLIHAGANVDPSSIELLKSPKHRNCAEKQAANSAATELLENQEMQIMFLYRENNSAMKTEKLVPCIDCYQKYVTNLIQNNGKLVVVLDDNKPRSFSNDKSYDNSIDKLGSCFYKILDSKALMNLNTEQSLGARVCAEHQS